MKHSRFTSTGIGLAAILGTSVSFTAAAQGNLVVNGGFDTDAAGWTASNVAPGGGYHSANGNPGGFFFLVQLSSSSPSIISQTINSLTPGDIYIISGDYSQGKQGSADDSFGVAINGTYFFDSSTLTSVDWQNFSFTYTADSSTAVLSLAAQLNGTIPYGVDNIVMQPVPEPGVLSLLGMGGLLFGLSRWRYRKAKAV